MIGSGRLSPKLAGTCLSSTSILALMTDAMADAPDGVANLARDTRQGQRLAAFRATVGGECRLNLFRVHVRQPGAVQFHERDVGRIKARRCGVPARRPAAVARHWTARVPRPRRG